MQVPSKLIKRRRHVILLFFLLFPIVFVILNSMEAIKMTTTTTTTTSVQTTHPADFFLPNNNNAPEFNHNNNNNNKPSIINTNNNTTSKDIMQQQPPPLTNPAAELINSTTARRRSQPPQTLFPPKMFWTMKKFSQLSTEERNLRDECKKINPNYQAKTYNDKTSRGFVLQYFPPEYLTLYDSFNKPVMKADMWRYLILYKFGGVYFDLDVECLTPIDTWDELLLVVAAADKEVHDGWKNVSTTSSSGGGINSWQQSAPPPPPEGEEPVQVQMVLGIENRDLGGGGGGGDDFSRFQIVQWTIASQPMHPIMKRTVELINETMTLVNQGKYPEDDIISITGPVIFTKAVVEYMILHGRLKKEQVRIYERNQQTQQKNDFPGQQKYWVEVNDTTLDPNKPILVGNVLILHKDAFGFDCPRKNYYGKKYIKHHFAGRWRKPRIKFKCVKG